MLIRANRDEGPIWLFRESASGGLGRINRFTMQLTLTVLRRFPLCLLPMPLPIVLERQAEVCVRHRICLLLRDPAPSLRECDFNRPPLDTYP